MQLENATTLALNLHGTSFSRTRSEFIIYLYCYFFLDLAFILKRRSLKILIAFFFFFSFFLWRSNKGRQQGSTQTQQEQKGLGGTHFQGGKGGKITLNSTFFLDVLNSVIPSHNLKNYLPFIMTL